MAFIARITIMLVLIATFFIFAGSLLFFGYF